MSRRQLRGAANRSLGIRPAPVTPGPVRARGVEAVGEAQHRTKVNPRKAGHPWVSRLHSATPDIRSREASSGGGGGAKTCAPYPLRSPWIRTGGRTRGNSGTTFREKSDHLVVARKPGNAGGAKGVMG